MSGKYARSLRSRTGFQVQHKSCAGTCAFPSRSLSLTNSFISRIFHTSYMGTQNSSKETRERSKKLSEEIGSYHVDFNFDSAVSAIISMFSTVTNFHPKFKVHGGGWAENAALQNVQARLRMVLAYLYASLLPTVRKRRSGGSLLVLGSSNVDEWYRPCQFSPTSANMVIACEATLRNTIAAVQMYVKDLKPTLFLLLLLLTPSFIAKPHGQGTHSTSRSWELSSPPRQPPNWSP